MFETLSVEKKGHVAHVVLTKPTMPPLFFQELGQAFDDLALDTELRCVVLRSAAKHFTYGLDLAAAFSDLGSSLDGTASSRMALHRRILELQSRITRVAACPVPVIAAIHGWCIGGGIDLVTACDIRIATRDAKFSVRETKVAIVADLGTLQRLTNVVGQGVARELAFTGRDIGAERALAIGLVNELHADAATLLEAADRLADEIAQNPPLTVRGVKRVLDFGLGRRVEDGLEYVAAWNSAFLASEDLGEAMSAFLEKRQPAFRGK
jgi:enoyl-CoA hydratase